MLILLYLSPRLFSAFQQFNDDVNRQIQGTGIGLAFCKKLAEKMGGFLVAESEGLGKGCRFTSSFLMGIESKTAFEEAVEDLDMTRSVALDRLKSFSPSLSSAEGSRKGSLKKNGEGPNGYVSSPILLSGPSANPSSEAFLRGIREKTEARATNLSPKEVDKRDFYTCHEACLLLRRDPLRWKSTRVLVVCSSSSLLTDVFSYCGFWGAHVAAFQQTSKATAFILSLSEYETLFDAVIVQDSAELRSNWKAFSRAVLNLRRPKRVQRGQQQLMMARGGDYAVSRPVSPYLSPSLPPPPLPLSSPAVPAMDGDALPHSLSDLEEMVQGRPPQVLLLSNATTTRGLWLPDGGVCQVLKRPLRYDKLLSAVFSASSARPANDEETARSEPAHDRSGGHRRTVRGRVATRRDADGASHSGLPIVRSFSNDDDGSIPNESVGDFRRRLPPPTQWKLGNDGRQQHEMSSLSMNVMDALTEELKTNAVLVVDMVRAKETDNRRVTAHRM